MNQTEARALLGLAEGFTRPELSGAYRRMVRLVHPDRMTGSSDSEKLDATALLGRVNQANEVLEKSLGARTTSLPKQESPPSRPSPSASAPPRQAPRQSPPPRREQSSQPKPPPMTYEQFLHRSNQETWVNATKPTSSQPGANQPSGGPSRPTPQAARAATSPTTPRPVVGAPVKGRGLAIGIVVVFVLALGTAAALVNANSNHSSTASVVQSEDATDAPVQTSVTEPPEMDGEQDAGTTADVYATYVAKPSCMDGDYGCWQIHLAAANDTCTAAHIVTKFKRTQDSTSGPTKDYDIFALSTAGAEALEIDAPAARYQYIELAVTCTS